MRKPNGFYDLTENVLSKGKYRGFHRRNIFEAITATGIVLLIIQIIPFTPIYTLMSSIVFGCVTFYVFLKGKSELSLTQILALEIRFRHNQCSLHLRGPEYKTKGDTYINNEYENKSVVEVLWQKANESLRRFIDTYSQS